MPDTLEPQVRRRSTMLSVLAGLLAVGLGALAAAATAAEATDVPGETDAAAIDNPLDAQKAGVALVALEERSEFVNEMLLDTSRAYRKVAIERGSVQQELVDALERLDREAIRSRELTRERLDELVHEADRARLRVAQLLEESLRRLADMRLLMIERDQLARRIAVLRSRMPQGRELLTGVWEVNWLPAGVSGTFYLDQSGTLVTGQYKLGPLGTGSLQGTFVNGKLYLQRIDSQRGRDAELEGVLDADGTRIRGSWQNFEMVQGGIPRGQWVARRAR